MTPPHLNKKNRKTPDSAHPVEGVLKTKELGQSLYIEQGPPGSKNADNLAYNSTQSQKKVEWFYKKASRKCHLQVF